MNFMSFYHCNCTDIVFPSQVALLCGAPGLGKTTLAHVIAQHAGYQAVEMNARFDISF